MELNSAMIYLQQENWTYSHFNSNSYYPDIVLENINYIS